MTNFTWEEWTRRAREAGIDLSNPDPVAADRVFGEMHREIEARVWEKPVTVRETPAADDYVIRVPADWVTLTDVGTAFLDADRLSGQDVRPFQVLGTVPKDALGVHVGTLENAAPSTPAAARWCCGTLHAEPHCLYCNVMPPGGSGGPTYPR